MGSASISRPRGSLGVVERYAFKKRMARITIDSLTQMEKIKSCSVCILNSVNRSA